VREALADLVQEGVAEMEPRAGRRPARWRLTEAVSFRARTNPSPETKRNESPDPPPGGTPEDHPPDPDPPPAPPGPDDPDEETYLALERAAIQEEARWNHKEEALPEWAVRLAEELPRRPETDPGAVAQAAAALLGPPLGPEDLSPATDQDPPVEPCWCCRGRRWWLRPRHLGGGWVCGRCRPPGPVEPVRWHETGPDGPNGPVSQPEADPPDWWTDAADLDDLERFMDDSDPGDPEAEPPDWPDAWPEADPVEVRVRP
jgi:hypothetical protein